MGNRIVLDPHAILDVAVQWSGWLEDGDAIATSTWLSPDGLTTTNPSLVDAKAIVWVSGGQVGQTYRIVNRVTTTAGRVDDRTLHVYVIER